MIEKINKSFIANIFCFCLALYLFNISVDIPDKKSETFTEDLTYNDQESIVEFFVEKVLGFKNFFKEYDDVDNSEESSFHNGFNLYITQNFKVSNYTALIYLSKHNYHYTFLTTSKPYLEITSPPPDIILYS